MEPVSSVHKFMSQLVGAYNLTISILIIIFGFQTACSRFFPARVQTHRKAYSIECEHLTSGVLLLMYECNVALNLYCKIADENNPTNMLDIHWSTTTDQISLAPKKMIPANTTLVIK